LFSSVWELAVFGALAGSAGFGCGMFLARFSPSGDHGFSKSSA